MRIVVLTGAGLSAESGLGTFRDKGGVWTQYDLNDVATPEGFARDPAQCHAFYNERRRGMVAAAPNAAHRALAELQTRRPNEVTLVTQNIDDLLERAGAPAVIHMHGELLRAFCGACGARRDQRDDLAVDTACAACGAVGAMRPDVVWFGEIPYHLDAIETAMRSADLFVSIGTSGEVYPAAGFVETARQLGISTLELNLEPTSTAFDDRRLGKATDVVPRWVEETL